MKVNFNAKISKQGAQRFINIPAAYIQEVEEKFGVGIVLKVTLEKWGNRNANG